jgi:MraZ protein
MLPFSAISCALLDDKRRVVLPASFKKALGELAEEPLIIEKDPYKKCLNIYPRQLWYKKLENLKSTLNPFNEYDSEFLEQIYESYAEVIMAPNGRINIPDELMEEAEITKDVREVVFTGRDDAIKLWNESVYRETKAKRTNIGVKYRERFGDNSNND